MVLYTKSTAQFISLEYIYYQKVIRINQRRRKIDRIYHEMLYNIGTDQLFRTSFFPFF